MERIGAVTFGYCVFHKNEFLYQGSHDTRDFQEWKNVRLFLDTSLNVLDASGTALPIHRPSTTLAAGDQAKVIVNLTIP